MAKENEQFFCQLQSRLLFSDEQLDAYIAGELDQKIVEIIESDPGYLCWEAEIYEEK